VAHDDALYELARLSKPRPVEPVLGVLRGGAAGPYGTDGEWAPHHMGRPKGPSGAFDGDALVTGVVSLAFLATRLPAGDPLQLQLPRLRDLIAERLENPGLLLFGGYPKAPPADSGGAWRFEHGYLYFCPARVRTAAQAEVLRGANRFTYPNDTWPWSSVFPALDAFRSPGFTALLERVARSPLKAGQWELDPRASAPALVARAAGQLGLPQPSAALFLQLLTLADCSDALLREANGWSAAELAEHGAALVKAGLASDEKRPRATRKLSVPGPWDALKPPHPAVERAKLELYGARLEGKALAAPLGRMLPLEPLPDLFARAFERWAKDAPVRAAPPVAAPKEHLAAIRASPEDDGPRHVYADWLLGQGDARGELIHLQCRHAAAPSPELEAAVKALLAANEARWLTRSHSYIAGHRWTRGFVTEVTAHAPTFVKGARQVFEECPLLEGFVFHGSISAAQVKALAGSPELARFTSLDTGQENYFSKLELLETLLASPHLPALKRLRVGFHRPGQGLGVPMAKAIAGSPRLAASLEELELQGQNLGRTFMNAPLGTDALEVLLGGLQALRVLRVPYNGYGDAEAKEIAARLAQGLAPKLERLDFSNTVATDYVTLAVKAFANRVSASGQQAVDAALKGRAGRPLARPPPAPPPTEGRPAVQEGRYPLVERAKSGRSKCVVCSEKIADQTVRIGILRISGPLGPLPAWIHAACRAQCPELAALGAEAARALSRALEKA